MTLTVETGTGSALADAFVSEAEADAYHAARGNSTWTGDSADKEVAIRRATSYVSESYAWAGYRKEGRDQALAWPRIDVTDREGFTIPSDQVPVEVKSATYEIALRELVTPGAMTPDYTPSDRVKMEKIGPMTVEYDLSRRDAGSVVPVIQVIQDLIGPFLRKTGGRLGGEAVR